MSDVLVDAVRVRPVVIPMPVPAEMAGGVMTSNPVALIDVRDSEGRWGSSYLRTYSTVPLPPLVRLLEDLAELVEGRPAAPADLAHRIPHTLRVLGVNGLVGLALAGLDMALWDLEAQAAEVSLAALLGATAAEVPAYATLRSRDPRRAAREAEAAVERGFMAVKLKLGGQAPEADGRLVRAVRSSLGPSVAIMGDFNQSLTVDEALARASQLDALGLAWIEEPTSAADLSGHAQIAATLATPVQCGENLEGPEGVRQSIAASASDLLMLDAMKVGGVSGWIEASAQAAGAGLPVSSHAFPEYSVHLLARSPTAHWLEFVDHLSAIREGTLDVRDGCLRVPEEPGVGLRWDEQAVARLLA